MSRGPGRRDILLAGAALLAAPRKASASNAVPDGWRGFSESVHCGIASADGSRQLTVRLCRYPALGVAWVWVHALVDGNFYGFTDHAVPSGTTPAQQGADNALFEDAAGHLAFRRSGSAAAVQAVSVGGACNLHRSTVGRHGPGDIPARLAMSFRPLARHDRLLPGRAELFGTGAARLDFAGRAISFEGSAQYHEQGQQDPRFVVPFSYASLWGGDQGITLLLTPEGRGGYVVRQSTSKDLAGFEIAPPGLDRAAALDFGKGDQRIIHIRARCHYTIPVHDRLWLGSMVSSDIDGRRHFGQLNDFQPRSVPFLHHVAPGNKGA